MDKGQVADDLRGGAQYIRDHGHTTGMMTNAAGWVCAMGGIRGHCGTLSDRCGWGQRDSAATVALARHLEPSHEPPSKAGAIARLSWATSIVASWNDRAGTTAEEVVTTMEKAAARIEEQA